MAKQNHFSRRRFLQTTTMVAAVAPQIIPGRVWAAETKPSERITMGIIGTGKQALGLMNGFLRRGQTQVVAVCDVDTTRREHAKKSAEDYYAQKTGSGSYKGCAAYEDFRELLARKDIDAVVVGTPDHWHAIPVITAAQAKKDIYCEKPLSLTIREGRAMVNAVRKNDRVFQTGSQQRSSENFRRACELVRSGRIGKVQKVEVAIGPPSKWCDLPEEKAEPGLDWNFWLGPAPARPYNSVLSPRGVHDHFPNWRNYREYSGGMMTDWGAHHFDIAQWGLGMDESGPVEIIPPEDPKATRGLRYLYANGVEMVHVNGDGVVFHGTDGKIHVNRGKFEATPAEIAQEPLGANEVHLYKSNSHQDDWLECIRTRKKPICDVEVGARSVTVCHLGNIAYWNNRRLKWDPGKEEFIGDPEANLFWRDIVRRDPWRLEWV